MVTGASTADLAIVLVDARKGVLAQSKRHAFISSLLGIPHVVVCVNKMDLVDFDEEVFDADRRGVRPLRGAPGDARRDVHPDLGAARRQRRRALGGDALVPGAAAALPPRARAHRLRPQPDRRALPGPVGDPPAGERASPTTAPTPARSPAASCVPATRSSCCPAASARRSPAIDTFDGPVEEAFPPMSVAVRLADDIDVGARLDDRAHAQPADGRQPLRGAASAGCPSSRCTRGRRYLVKHTTRTAMVGSVDVRYRIDVETCAATKSVDDARAQRPRARAPAS